MDTHTNKTFPKIERRCRSCNKEEVKNQRMYRCSGCRLVLYCNKECQTKDWNEKHLVECLKHANQILRDKQSIK